MKSALRVGLVCASLLCGGVVGELALRALNYSYTPLEIRANNNSGEWRFLHAYRDGHFVYDPILIWRPRKNVHPFNDDGFQGAALSTEAKAGEFRLFTLGDSNTLGWAGAVGDKSRSWPLRLQEELRYPGGALKLTNAGVYGHTSFQGKRLLRELLPYRPDMVLISYGFNDAHRVSISDADFVSNTIAAKLWFFNSPFFRLRTIQLMAASWDRWGPGGSPFLGEPTTFRVDIESYTSNLIEMAAMCKESGIRCVFLTRPYVARSTDDTQSWLYYIADYREATLEAANAAQVPIIDVYSAFAQRPELFADDNHFSENGSIVAARFIARELDTLLNQGRTPN